MVMKMNTESTMTEVIPNQATQSASTITITLHPQPKNLDLVCDSKIAVTGETTTTTATTLTNMSPTSSDDDSLHQAQVMMKRSLKLDLNQNDDERVESLESVSPHNDVDTSMKSPRSPMSPGRSGKVQHS